MIESSIKLRFALNVRSIQMIPTISTTCRTDLILTVNVSRQLSNAGLGKQELMVTDFEMLCKKDLSLHELQLGFPFLQVFSFPRTEKFKTVIPLNFRIVSTIRETLEISGNFSPLRTIIAVFTIFCIFCYIFMLNRVFIFNNLRKNLFDFAHNSR